MKLYVGDICDRLILQDQMKDHDIVVHFAAESHVDRSINSAYPFIETNVLGTLNVLESARETGIQTIIHISTDEVYGSLENGSADESYPLLPNSPYAASKAASDLVTRSFFQTFGLDIRVTRCSNNYGKYQHPEKFIPVVINSILNQSKIPIYGTGQNIREWIHVRDHCKAILKVLAQGRAGEIYNIGSGKYLNNVELAQNICRIMNAPEELITFVEDRKGHDFRYSIDSRKCDSLQVGSRFDFQFGLKETVEWYVSHQAWWG